MCRREAAEPHGNQSEEASLRALREQSSRVGPARAFCRGERGGPLPAELESLRQRPVYQLTYRRFAFATFRDDSGEELATDMLSSWYFWQERLI